MDVISNIVLNNNPLLQIYQIIKTEDYYNNEIMSIKGKLNKLDGQMTDYLHICYLRNIVFWSLEMA